MLDGAIVKLDRDIWERWLVLLHSIDLCVRAFSYFLVAIEESVVARSLVLLLQKLFLKEYFFAVESSSSNNQVH